MFNFTNFHDKSRATFTQCDRPDRDPDFVSESGSAYWDMGSYVIREADHWSDQIGNIKSCNWELAGGSRYGQTVCGRCNYADFKLRKTVPVWHKITKADVNRAQDLADCGGACAASEWTTGSGRNTSKKDVPAWVGEIDANKIDAPASVRRLHKKRPQVKKVVFADPATIRKILNGAKRIKIGERLV